MTALDFTEQFYKIPIHIILFCLYSFITPPFPSIATILQIKALLALWSRMFTPCNPSQSVQRAATAAAHFFLPDLRFLMHPQRPTNQIILTRPLSLKLCNPGFELNQVAVGERKRTLCDFSLELTPKGTNLPHVLYPSDSLWAGISELIIKCHSYGGISSSACPEDKWK